MALLACPAHFLWLFWVQLGSLLGAAPVPGSVRVRWSPLPRCQHLEGERTQLDAPPLLGEGDLETPVLGLWGALRAVPVGVCQLLLTWTWLGREEGWLCPCSGPCCCCC